MEEQLVLEGTLWWIQSLKSLLNSEKKKYMPGHGLRDSVPVSKMHCCYEDKQRFRGIFSFPS